MYIRQLFLCITTIVAVIGTSFADSPYGVCAHLQRWEYERADEELAQMKCADIDQVRFDFDRNLMEPQPEKWDFSRWDSLAVLAEKHGIGILPILGYNVKWASPAWKHLPEWLNYVDAVAERYGFGMPYLEIWNEENIRQSWGDASDGENYANLLISTYRVIKKRNSAIKVVFGGTNKIPLDFIEASFRAGAAQAMDVMAVHPYRLLDIPEVSLADDIAALRRLMTKYGAGDKPIWFTEVGYSSAPKVISGLMPQLFAELGMKPEQTTILFFHDPRFPFDSGPTQWITDEVQGLKAARPIRLADLAMLSPKADTLLILPEKETFPATYRAALLSYVRRGGRVLSPGGLPLYFLLDRNAAGQLETSQVNSRYMPEFHMNWYTPWTREGTPSKIDKYEYAPKYATSLLPPFISAFRFFDSGNLKPGDRFEPVLYGIAGNFRGVLAGVYHFDSDLKGKIAVCGILTDTVGEDEQAQLLPRTMLISFSAGVERIYWYSFRSTEWDNGREAHFGIVRNNMTPKPAYHAYKTLTAMYPPGSAGLAVRRQGELWVASWRKPDGERIQAVWTSGRETPATCSGTFKTAVDYLGKVALIRKTGENRFEFTAGPGIFYLLGSEQLEVLK